MNNNNISLQNFISYNVASRSDLAGLSILVEQFKPLLIFLQEVKITLDQLKIMIGNNYSCELNSDPDDPNKPGTAVAWLTNIDVTVTNIVPRRLQLVSYNMMNFVNVYAHSGSQGRRARCTLFSVDLFNLIQSLPSLPVMTGDWNCVVLPQDVEEDGPGEKSQFNAKKSIDLSNLIASNEYIDAFPYCNTLPDFTWLRKGRRQARLDRTYFPPTLISSLVSVVHSLHLSDHKAVIFFCNR